MTRKPGRALTLVLIIALSLTTAITTASASDADVGAERMVQQRPYSIRPKVDASFAFTLAATNTDVTVEKRNSKNDHQLWIQGKSDGQGYFRLQNKSRKDMCLAIPSGSGSANVFAWPCGTHTGYYWKWTKQQQLLNKDSGKVVAPQPPPAPGKPIVQWTSGDGKADLVRYEF
ncbi:RICIN domain-containing protein [Saccharothrix syringae]|nr:RICIN domain-containing protein [Saccharothrix syringae]